MVRRCSDKVAKMLLIIFNTLLLASGICILVWAFVGLKTAKSASEIASVVKDVNTITVAVGVIIVLIGFFGFCGAWRESTFMLNAFVVCLVLIIIGEAVVGYLAFQNRGYLEDAVRKGATETLKKYSTRREVKDAWDDIQLTFACCGIDGPDDWKRNDEPTPTSCCKNVTGGQPCTEAMGWFKDGCLPKIRKFTESNSMSIGAVAIGVAFIEVIGIIFACCLHSAIKDRYEAV